MLPGDADVPVLRLLWSLSATLTQTLAPHRHLPPNSAISGAMRHLIANTGAYDPN